MCHRVIRARHILPILLIGLTLLWVVPVRAHTDQHDMGQHETHSPSGSPVSTSATPITPEVNPGIPLLITGLVLVAVGGVFAFRLQWKQPGFQHALVAITVVIGTLAAVAGAGLALTPPALSGELRAEDAWARPAPQHSSGAVYLTLENGTADDERLTGASAAVAARVELHETVIVDDVGQMNAVESVELPSGSTLEIVPFGIHLMLIDLHEALQIGDTFPLTLEFASGQRLEVEVEVKLDGQ